MSSPSLKAMLVVAAVAAMIGVTAGTAAAQAGGIRGRVLEAKTQRPLNGAQVFIPGTTRGALTNEAGRFVITNLPDGAHTVRVAMIGYTGSDQTVTVSAGQFAEADFALAQSAIALDEIVVTGTAGAVSKRTLGNAITKIDAATATQQATIHNLTELLTARAPGMQILPNSGVTGTAADIRIRGASSLIGNEPVVYVDGIRYNTGDIGTFTPSGAGTTSFSGQRTSAFDFINPNDIESIEVIKGPAAATLYGAEAANGVIQIITKKGGRGEQRVQWTAKTEYGQNEWALEIPDNYTTCDAVRKAEKTGGQPTWPGCQDVPVGSVIRANPLRDDPVALRAGDVQKASLSMRGGGERYSFYIAGDHELNEGVFFNNSNKRQSVRANFVLSPTDKVEITLSSAYTKGHLRLPVGDEAAQGMLLSAFRGRPGRVTTNPLNTGWATTRAEQANLYDNQTKSDRLTIGSTVNINPVRWFRNRVTLGLDFTSSLAQVLSPAGSVDADYSGILEGSIAQRTPRSFVYSVDYAGNLEKDLSSSLRSTTSFGMQAVNRRYETLYAFGRGLGAPDITLIGNATATFGSNSYSQAKAVGVFAQEQLGWKNRIFVTAALRADDNSAFGDEWDYIYYPKGSLSWILSEEPALQGLFESARVTNFKLRGAYGHAGRAPDPFAADQTYTVDKAVLSNGTLVAVIRPRSLGNQGLVAERGSEFEVGFDVEALEDRAGLEFTYYKKRMKDAIISTAAPASTGFGSIWSSGTFSVLKNLGETLNSGIEVGLMATPLQLPNFVWDSRVSLSTNQNELVTFGDARTREPISGQSYGSVQMHRKGYPLAGYWAALPKRNPDGTLVLSATGFAIADTASFIGPSAPTREVAFSNTFTLFRDFRVFTLFDYKGGHYMYNYKEYARCNVAAQLNCERVNDTEMLNSPDRPAWRLPGSWIEKADFIKLRDVSLTYGLPAELARSLRANAASVTLAGHNLALWSDYSGMDPEVNGYGNRNFARSDVYPVPMTRRLSMSLNVSF